MKVYVYIWFRPDGTPFYVGIGKTSNRWNPEKTKQKDRNPLCWKILQKYGPKNVKSDRIEVASWEEACEKEKLLIAHFGRFDSGGVLANFTDGGEGVANPSEKNRLAKRVRLLDPNNPMREYHKELNTDPTIRAKRNASNRSPEARAKKSVSSKAMWESRSPEAREKHALATKVGKARIAPPKKAKPLRMTKEQLSLYRSNLLRLRNNNPAYQANRIEKLKAASDKISQGVLRSMGARLATMQTEEVQKKLRAPKTAAHRLKISIAKKGVPRTGFSCNFCNIELLPM